MRETRVVVVGAEEMPRNNDVSYIIIIIIKYIYKFYVNNQCRYHLVEPTNHDVPTRPQKPKRMDISAIDTDPLLFILSSRRRSSDHTT